MSISWPFSKSLQSSELKYKIIKKQAYALVKTLKKFREYILTSKSIVYLPHIAVNDILLQHDTKGIRGKWVVKIQEYDLELKPIKIIKG